jgi:lysophospholipase L1-like esterase
MMKEIIFIGDSLTEFYDWQNRFPAYRVKNLGNAGEPVEGLLERMRRLRIFSNPDYFFLMTGINNLMRGDHDIAGRYKEVLDLIAVEVRVSVIVVQSILPVTRCWVPPAVIEAVNSALRRMTQSHGMIYFDLYSLFLDGEGHADPALFYEDGVHISDKGYAVWSDAVEKFLNV